jgi:hypothetical protein
LTRASGRNIKTFKDARDWGHMGSSASGKRSHGHHD